VISNAKAQGTKRRVSEYTRVNEKFHIENEFIMQLDHRKYELIPAFIIAECDRIISDGG